MFEQTTQVRVRYAETDQMGYVYYGNYATYFEVARVESLRSLGLSYKELEDQGVMMPVLENKSKYLAPAKYDELLTIKTTIKKKPAVRIQFDYEIYNESDKLIHIGETVLVFVDMKTGKPCLQPEVMAKLLNPFFD
ncbi:thioesterase family protein [Fulvivirga kasyanovii]|uniref:Acyl-CoA thioesterase n=1 Tax=Fulvivirga kasyanovii TaxID=396812 RepID=A0ABW9RK29_9BACT|nr:thioesterase family protein [Fulvivirga kasyanovii]MTI23763.1 acyl-CoA thioesterase [Fulvivirga kasyanovii]